MLYHHVPRLKRHSSKVTVDNMNSQQFCVDASAYARRVRHRTGGNDVGGLAQLALLLSASGS